MIYENDISYIVMLGNTIEGRTQKVDQYWENLNNGPLRLKCLTIETKVETFVTGSNNSIIYREFLVRVFLIKSKLIKLIIIITNYLNYIYLFSLVLMTLRLSNISSIVDGLIMGSRKIVIQFSRL